MSAIGSRQWLLDLGFSDWVSVAYMLGPEWREYSRRPEMQVPGLYSMVRSSTAKSNLQDGERFNPRHVGLAGEIFQEIPNKSKPGQWRRRWWAIEALRERWLSEVELVYLGKSDPPLKIRVGQLRRFALGGLGHTGGQVLWQLRGYAESLDIGVLPVSRFPKTLPAAPRLAEKQLLAEFRRQFGTLPYANIVG